MGMCVVENLFRMFLFGWPLLHLWVIRVYIVWVKDKKVTLKIFQVENFAGTSRDGLSHEALEKCSQKLDSSTSTCASLMPFSPKPLLLSFSWICRETALIFILCLILHQLNTKPNTIKSHKIQGTKFMQLQHFLLWNKVKIKHNKSQLYNFFLDQGLQDLLMADTRISTFV